MIKRREIGLCILFSFLTCGIYSIYWLATLSEDINTLYGDESATSGPMVVLLSIITCGIYLLYWYYKAGTKMNEVNVRNNRAYPDTSKGVIYLILGLFGLGIVSMAMIQNDVNNYANVF